MLAPRVAHARFISELSGFSDISAALILAIVVVWFPGSVLVLKAMDSSYGSSVQIGERYWTGSRHEAPLS